MSSALIRCQPRGLSRTPGRLRLRGSSQQWEGAGGTYAVETIVGQPRLQRPRKPTERRLLQGINHRRERSLLLPIFVTSRCPCVVLCFFACACLMHLDVGGEKGWRERWVRVRVQFGWGGERVFKPTHPIFTFQASPVCVLLLLFLLEKRVCDLIMVSPLITFTPGYCCCSTARQAHEGQGSTLRHLETLALKAMTIFTTACRWLHVDKECLHMI